VIFLRRRQAEHQEHLLAQHRLDGPTIPPRLLVGHVVQRADLQVQGIQVRWRLRRWSGVQGTAQHRHELPLTDVRQGRVSTGGRR
jgi:hypothetical protein